MLLEVVLRGELLGVPLEVVRPDVLDLVRMLSGSIDVVGECDAGCQLAVHPGRHASEQIVDVAAVPLRQTERLQSRRVVPPPLASH